MITGVSVRKGKFTQISVITAFSLSLFSKAAADGKNHFEDTLSFPIQQRVRN